ncbi:hypothetical protein BLOT_009300 [Blomia tropicalis]|nr:hypothetical protein BLOT_009300 [Blomia tropicalis]
MKSVFLKQTSRIFVYNESKPKWLEEKIAETCSYSVKNGTDLEMSKTMNKLCSIYKLMNVTNTTERKNIMNCLFDDQWNNLDICHKWWTIPHNTTTGVISEKELGLFQFADLVKDSINHAEKCLYHDNYDKNDVSDNHFETCEFLEKYNKTILFSFQRVIYQKLSQRDLLDQQAIEHCFLYQFDEFQRRACVSVTNGTHLNGFTMSKERQTRIRLLSNVYQDNMFRCLIDADNRNCIDMFNIRKSCPLSNLMKTTSIDEHKLILSCLIDDQYLNSDYICHKWWNEPPVLTKDNLSEEEIKYYQFSNFVKGVIKQAEQCLFGLNDKTSKHCKSFKNHKKVFTRSIYEKLFLRDVQDQKFVEHCFIHHQIHEYYKCVGISDGRHIKGFTMSNERTNRIIGLWNNMNKCLKHFDNKTCLARLDPTNACADQTKEQCIQMMNCKYSRSWLSDPLNLCHVLIGNKVIDKTIHHPEVRNLIHNFVKWHDNEDIEDCINFHKDADDGICKKLFQDLEKVSRLLR